MRVGVVWGWAGVCGVSDVWPCNKTIFIYGSEIWYFIFFMLGVWITFSQPRAHLWHTLTTPGRTYSILLTRDFFRGLYPFSMIISIIQGLFTYPFPRIIYISMGVLVWYQWIALPTHKNDNERMGWFYRFSDPGPMPGHRPILSEHLCVHT